MRLPMQHGGQPIRASGIPWYMRQDYPRILHIMADVEVLPPTYEAWRKRADQIKREITKQGGIAVEAIIDPATLPAWCAARGLNVDANARSQFASEWAFRHHGNTH